MITPNTLLSMSVEHIAQRSVAELLSVLVQIPSVNPLWQWTTDTVANEKQIAEFLVTLFSKLGDRVKVEIVYVTPTRPNVMVRIEGEEPEWIVWDTHIDTVGTNNMVIDPFCGEINDGKVWGRGACDTKASAALAIKLVFKAMVEGRKPKKNLLLAFTMGEENGGEGAKEVNPWLKQQAILVHQWITSEPTMLHAVFSHNGLIRGQFLLTQGTMPIIPVANTKMRFQISGRSGHTSDPDKAISALTAAARILIIFESITGLHVTTIQSGGYGNTIPNYCEIVVSQEEQAHLLSGQDIIDLAQPHLKPGENISWLRQHTEQYEDCDPTIIYAAARVVLEIAAEHERLKSTEHLAVTGLPVVSATGLSSKTNSCVLSIDRRVVPGEDPEVVLRSLKATLDSSLNNPSMVLSENAKPVMRKQPGFLTDLNSTLVRRLVDITGNPYSTAKYGTNLLCSDPSVFVSGEINAVVFGPGDISQAHTADEFIEITQLELALKVMAEFLSR